MFSLGGGSQHLSKREQVVPLPFPPFRLVHDFSVFPFLVNKQKLLLEMCSPRCNYANKEPPESYSY